MKKFTNKCSDPFWTICFIIYFRAGSIGLINLISNLDRIDAISFYICFKYKGSENT